MSGNPFIDAFWDSDFIGKIIFIGLILLSIVSWSVLLHKMWMARKVRALSQSFKRAFQENRQKPLSIAFAAPKSTECPNAFMIIYEVLKHTAEEIFTKNSKGQTEKWMSTADISLLEAQANSTISSITKYLEKNLYVLSTIVTLAPFLGLLGTVYGILVTFSTMHGGDAQAATNQAVLSGLSLALTTTVIGLIDAIPALIGYNYLKNQFADFDHEMDKFATDVLSTFELSFRTVEV